MNKKHWRAIRTIAYFVLFGHINITCIFLLMMFMVCSCRRGFWYARPGKMALGEFIVVLHGGTCKLRSSSSILLLLISPPMFFFHFLCWLSLFFNNSHSYSEWLGFVHGTSVYRLYTREDYSWLLHPWPLLTILIPISFLKV